MAEIQNIGNPLELATELAKMEDAQVIGQIMVQQGAVHAVSFLLNNGCRRDTARSMLDSLRANAAVVRAEAVRRGITDPFPQDQLAAPAEPTAPAATAAHRLRAMATNYPAGHLWDRLDAKACIQGALELEALHKRVSTYEARDALGLIPAPAHPDDAAVDRFAAAMKAKLASARAQGRSGWEDKAQCHQEDLALDLRKHMNKGDPVDVGNFAMMLHQRGESTKLRGLSQDLVDAIKNAPAGASVIEHNGHPVFITRASEEDAPMLGVMESNHSELQAKVLHVGRVMGEILVKVVDDGMVPKDLQRDMVVHVLYTPASEEAPDARVR